MVLVSWCLFDGKFLLTSLGVQPSMVKQDSLDEQSDDCPHKLSAMIVFYSEVLLKEILRQIAKN